MSQPKLAKTIKSQISKPVPRSAQTSTWADIFGNSWVLKMARRVSYWFLGLNLIEPVQCYHLSFYKFMLPPDIYYASL